MYTEKAIAATTISANNRFFTVFPPSSDFYAVYYKALLYIKSASRQALSSTIFCYETSDEPRASGRW